MYMVINISKGLYDRYKEKDHIKKCDIDEFEKALDRCIILPKGHGRLGDLDKLIRAMKERNDDAVEAIEGLPSAQPEIIHCRDCKHWQSEEYIGNNNVHTPNIASLPCKNWLTGGDWYCGSAERKDI